MAVSEITPEPSSIVGKVEGYEQELDFLAYGMKQKDLDTLILGQKYKIYWLEGLCYMEPFESGYLRQYVVYKIE